MLLLSCTVHIVIVHSIAHCSHNSYHVLIVHTHVLTGQNFHYAIEAFLHVASCDSLAHSHLLCCALHAYYRYNVCAQIILNC